MTKVTSLGRAGGKKNTQKFAYLRKSGILKAERNKGTEKQRRKKKTQNTKNTDTPDRQDKAGSTPGIWI